MSSPNSSALLARFNEIAAVTAAQSRLAAAQSHLSALHVMVTSPTTKAYLRAGAARRALWQQVAEVCGGQASLAKDKMTTLPVEAKSTKAKKRPTVTTDVYRASGGSNVQLAENDGSSALASEP